MKTLQKTIFERYQAEGLHNGSEFYMAPNIPLKKLTTAQSTYLQKSLPSDADQDVLILGDSTDSGSAKEGFCFTRTHLVFHDRKGLFSKTITECLDLRTIKTCQVSPKTGFFSGYLDITFADGKQKTISVGNTFVYKGDKGPRALFAPFIQEWSQAFT